MLQALRAPAFRRLWSAQTISLLGDGLVIVAVGLYVTRHTGSPADVGIVLFAYSLPLVAFILVGGILADRLPRQRVTVVTDLIRAVLHALLATLILTGTVRIWQMVLIGVGFGTAEAFFRPAYAGLVPQTVPEDDIQTAQALGAVSASVGTMVSPAIGTVLVLSVGAGVAFALDSLTFLISAALVAGLRPRTRNSTLQMGEAEVLTSESPLRQLAAGWQAVRERSWIWATIACYTVAVVSALAPFFVLGATVSRQHYGTEAIYGWVNASWGLGSVGGAVLAARWQPRHPMRMGMLLALWWPAAIGVYACGVPGLLAAAVLALAGMGSAAFGVWWETALAQRIPPQLLSRVSAWDWMGSLALLPLGYLLSGELATRFGAVHIMLIGAVIGTLAMLCGLLPTQTRMLERIEPVVHQTPN